MVNANIQNRKIYNHSDEAGLSMVEYVIALIIVMIAFVTWMNLTVTTVKNGQFVKRLGVVKELATERATELAKRSDEFVKLIPQDKQTIGSLFPSPPLDGFYESLDEQGNIISKSEEKKAIVKFVRQWLIAKDFPNKGSISVYVTVVSKDTNRIIRRAKAVKIDGIQVTGS